MNSYLSKSPFYFIISFFDDEIISSRSHRNNSNFIIFCNFFHILQFFSYSAKRLIPLDIPNLLEHTNFQYNFIIMIHNISHYFIWFHIHSHHSIFIHRGLASSKSQGGGQKPNFTPLFKKFEFYCNFMWQFFWIFKVMGAVPPLDPPVTSPLLLRINF